MRKIATKPKTHQRHVVPTPIASGNDEGPDMPFEESVHNALDANLRHRMISEAAYYLYANRNYADGYDMEDWLTAEQQVDHFLLNPSDRGGSSVETD